MNMIDAFKRLLDGQKITRPDWDDAYIIYDDDIYHNRFIGILNGKVIGATKQPIFTESISHSKMIEFRFHGEEESMIISLIDDDENKIYTTEEEKMELDTMKWRLYSYCFSFGTCNGCRLKNECTALNTLNNTELNNLSPKEVKRLYDLIKGEE